MSMLPPGPPGPTMKERSEPKVSRTRISDVSYRITMYLAEHPNRELSIEQIAKGTNLPFKSVAHALSRLLKLSVAKHGSASGYWIADVNARSDFNPSHRGSGVIASAGRQSVTPNGSSPARVRAESSSQLHDRDLMEVLRTRSDGRVVLVAENGDLYVATRIDV